MSEYLHYTGREPLFGLGYPGAPAGELGSPHDEGVKTTAIAERIAAMLKALGPGIYEGGMATLVDGAVEITALFAVVNDSLGALTITHAATVMAATEFPTGVSYLHVQATDDARTDMTCGYYVSASAEPATGALRVAKITKAGGVVAAVDCSVQTSPAIIARLPWAELLEKYGGTETLLDWLTRTLGADYTGATPPDAIADRLDLIEGIVTGGGDLPDIPTDDEIAAIAEEKADTAVAEHVVALHGTGGGGETVAAEQWDVVAINVLREAAAVAHYLPTVPATLQDAAVVVDGHCGDEFVDAVNSTF